MTNSTFALTSINLQSESEKAGRSPGSGEHEMSTASVNRIRSRLLALCINDVACGYDNLSWPPHRVLDRLTCFGSNNISVITDGGTTRTRTRTGLLNASSDAFLLAEV